MKVWSKKVFLKLPSGSRCWTFVFENLKCNLVVHCDRDNFWDVTISPWDIISEVFHPPVGFGETLKEAMIEFRFEMKRTDRKKF